MRRTRAVTVLAVAVAMAATPSVASAEQGYGGGEVSTVAEGLDGPRQLNSYTNGRLVVAESDTGEVSSVDPRTGRVSALVAGLPTPQGVDFRDGLLFIATGEETPDEAPSAAAIEESRGYGGSGCQASPTAAPSSLIVARPNGQIVKRWDLLCYELRNNPDRQLQFDPVTGEPLDALSNPFAVHVQANRILVADAGANAVLAIDRRTNKISTFFVPPRVPVSDVPECEGTNDTQGVEGCDPVPTGVTQDKNGNIYVSTLGGDQPNAGRVYVLSPAGKVLRVIKNLEPLTGIAVDSYGNVFVSELFAGLAGPPPTTEEGAEPIGQVVKITPRGARSYAQVTLPTGLEFNGGKLYASAWSVAAFVDLFGRGEVVRVSPGAFAAAPN
jgi:outer membrane protein assembly factor BamB